MENKINLNDDQVELSLLLEQFYKALDNMVELKVETILKNSDLLQLVPAEVTRVNKDNTLVMVNTGEIAAQVPNKSDSIIYQNDSAILINRYGSNLRNSFLLCKNGQESPLENKINSLEKNMKSLEKRIKALEPVEEE